jgi:hypothetical protein
VTVRARVRAGMRARGSRAGVRARESGSASESEGANESKSWGQGPDERESD